MILIKSHGGSSLILVIMTLIIVDCRRSESRWKGTIKNIGGVMTVHNPKEPMYAEVEGVFQIREDLTIGVQEGSPEYMFSRIRDLDVDEDGNIYVLDQREAQVRIFDAKGIHLKTIGHRGQGPGEFLSAYAVSVTAQNHVFVTDVVGRRVAVFDLQGRFLGNISMTESVLLLPTLDSSECFYDLVPSQTDRTRYELRKYSQDLTAKRILMTSPTILTPQKKYRLFAPMIQYDVGPDDNVVFGYPEDYEIEICDAEGRALLHIVRDFDPVALTQKELAVAEKRPPISDYTLEIPKHHCAYHGITLDDRGYIFIATWEKCGRGYYYDIFTPDGKYLTRTGFAFPPVVMRKNKLYAIEFDDEGYNLVRRYEYSLLH